MGTVAAVVTSEAEGGGRRLSIKPDRLPVAELALGDSVALDGACLTVTDVADGRFQVQAGAETLRVTTVSSWSQGTRLNLERALCLGDRLGGHMVLGHVDGVGEVTARVEEDANLVLTFRVPASVGRYVIPKGSLTVDGISLTVNEVAQDEVKVALIPHTVDMTALAGKHVGARVNLEADMIGKYVERLVAPYQST